MYTITSFLFLICFCIAWANPCLYLLHENDKILYLMGFLTLGFGVLAIASWYIGIGDIKIL